uniref:Uncharacterized protein n=1 Tax=Romanomermis culicivorax TaxID=13658 RepID=A0A915K513_ROMCU
MRRSSFDHNAKLIMNGKSEINTTKNRTKGPAKMKISKKAQKMLIGANGQPTNFGDQAASADQKLKIVESSSPTTELLPSLWSGKNRDEEKLTLSTSSSSNLPLTNAGDSSTTKSNSGSPNLSTAFPMNDEDILAVGTQMEDGDKLLSKLKRFLKTVYYFSKNLLPKQHDSVKELILKVIVSIQ